MTLPLIFSQPQVPPSKEFAKKSQGPPPWISNFCASMVLTSCREKINYLQNFIKKRKFLN
jgi:hypothetical protein